MRDRSGIVQAVLNPEYLPAEDYDAAQRLRSEWCVQVSGRVRRRPEGSENPLLPTGDVEIMAEKVATLNQSLTPPFYITDDVDADESLRLRYRYLDLRRPAMQRNLRLRHQVVKYIRDYLDAQGFLEIETPILIKAPPKARGITWCPAAGSPAASMPCPSRPSSSSSC